MSNVIFKAINSYKMIPPTCNVAWADQFDAALSPDTKRYAEERGLHLQVLAELLTQTVAEANGDPSLYDGILSRKMKDMSVIEAAAKKYGLKAFP